jgi:hypothetical protein
VGRGRYKNKENNEICNDGWLSYNRCPRSIYRVPTGGERPLPIPIPIHRQLLPHDCQTEQDTRSYPLGSVVVRFSFGLSTSSWLLLFPFVWIPLGESKLAFVTRSVAAHFPIYLLAVCFKNILIPPSFFLSSLARSDLYNLEYIAQKDF